MEVAVRDGLEWSGVESGVDGAWRVRLQAHSAQQALHRSSWSGRFLVVSSFFPPPPLSHSSNRCCSSCGFLVFAFIDWPLPIAHQHHFDRLKAPFMYIGLSPDHLSCSRPWPNY